MVVVVVVVMVVGTGRAGSCVLTAPRFSANWQGAVNRSWDWAGFVRQIAFAREDHSSVARSDECADAVWAQCCRCLRAEEKLLELEFQLDRTGTVRTKRRESPGKRWQGRSIAMSCQSLCQNENGKALGQWS